ncbi:MAG: asparagine synthase-related protein, partial [bacterium]
MSLGFYCYIGNKESDTYQYFTSCMNSLKLKNGITKYLYKKAVTPLIGSELAYRKKQMFTVPVGDWFKTKLKG